MRVPVFYSYNFNEDEINKSINSLKGDFDIYIMYHNDIDKSLFSNVNFINMDEYFETTCNFSRVFEIMIPKYTNFDKIIFINSKAIINSNLNDIYNIDLGNNVLAAKKIDDHFLDELLLIDTIKFKELNLFEKIITYMNDTEEELLISMNKCISNFLAIEFDSISDISYNPLERLDINKNEDRLKVLEKIHNFEKQGIFDLDVEEDPPTRPINPGEVDYECKKLKSRINARISLFVARRFLNKITRNKVLIIKDVIGAENFKNLKTGAVLTCNHFNALDSFAIHVAYDRSKHKKQKFFRVIREGNYTSFPGFYGYLMRNCRTLPLSNNVKVMGEFMKGCSNVLKNNHFILIYPEQSMWWNYRKPKPLKPGGFKIAAKNNVPVLPCFIGLKNSNLIGDDGFYIQEYTIFIDKPIYADSNLNQVEKMEFLMKENYRIWKKRYEEFYNLPLVYEK